MHRPVLVLLGLLVLPSAAAFSESDPNLKDEAGDQSAAGPATQWGDLLKAWVVEDAEGLQITLLVASLSMTDPAYYELLWYQTQTQQLTAAGLGARIDGGVASGFRISPVVRDACTVRQQPHAPGPSWPVTVQPGTPGRITWRILPSDLGVERGSFLFSFCAFSFAGTRLATAYGLDNARTPVRSVTNQTFQIGLWQAIRSEPFDVPTMPAFIEDRESERKPKAPSYDISGIQFDPGPRFVNVTVRMQAFDWADLEGRRWFLNLDISMYNPYGDGSRTEGRQAMVSVQNATVRSATVERLVQIDGNISQSPSTLLVQTGTPGYLRYSWAREEWKLPTDLAGLQIFLLTTSFDQEDQNDHMSLFPERYFDVPQPGVLVVLALLLAALVARRQR